MFGPIGGPELLLILVIALIVFGPRQLPDIGKSLGRMLGEFRRASNDFKRTLEDEVEADKQRAAPPPPSLPPAAEPPPAGTVPAAPESGAAEPARPAENK
jgi:sec-independent protein translocase protein TatB